MGYRDKDDRSRERRDRRPPLANWSSAAEFGDATIDRPTPLSGRRDRAARQSDRPAQRVRSDTAGWATITPVEDQRDEDSRADRRYSDDDSRADRRYSDDEPGPVSDSGSWRAYESEPVRPYGTASRRAYDTEPRATDDEPHRSGRSIEENPRRSRRALEESAQRAVEELTRRVRDDDPRLLGSVDKDDEPRGLRRVDRDDPTGRPDISDRDLPHDWSTSEPRSRHYRDDAGAGSWRTRQTTEFQAWRSESASAQSWRSETVSWRSREPIEVDASDIGSFGTRAIGSSESSAHAYPTQADSAGLDAWHSETGTWRTRDTATTGSWRIPPASDDATSLDGDTGEWRTQTTPETGSWSRSRGQWIPSVDDTGEQPDFTVRRYDDTGEIPKNLLETARSRILDQDERYDSGRRGDAADRRGDDSGERRADRRGDDSGERRADRRGDDSGERRGGRRYATDDDRFADGGGDRPGEWLGRRSSVGSEDRYDDEGPAAAGRSLTGTRGPRPAPSPRFEDVGDGYRDADEGPGRRSRYPRYDDGAPGYRAGRSSAGRSGVGRHAVEGYDDQDEGRPARAVARRAPAYAGPRGVADSVITPRASAGRGELVRVGRRLTEAAEDEDDIEEVAYGYGGAGVASVAWFGLPVGAFLLWAIFLGGTARADCVDAGGRPCPAPREAAFATFAAHLPQVGVAIVLSVLVALLIRLASPFWRPATVGFAASVVGAGVATVLFTVLNSG